MTDLQRHIAAVAEKPFDKVAALALADHFQEAAGYSRWTALRKVAAVRKPGRDAKFLARAARVMRSKTVARMELQALIEEELELDGYVSSSTFLVTGFGPPVATFAAQSQSDYLRAHVTINVGSRWVLLCYRELQKITREGTHKRTAPARK